MKILLKSSTRRKGRSSKVLISILAKGGGAKKIFQYCLNPNSSRHISYFRAIEGHSGGIAIDPELQDNVLLPQGYTEYIYHVGYSEVHSMITSGLIPGGQSLKRGRQSVFFMIANPMEDEKLCGGMFSRCKSVHKNSYREK